MEENRETKVTRILLVDDDMIFGKNLATILRERGYETGLADSANSAFEKLAEEKFDIVLLDVKLPDISGTEVFKKIKQDNPDIDIIMITAFSCDLLVKQLAEKSKFYCFSKPFDINEVLGAVDKLAKEKEGNE